jgi:hypothetical protein
MGGCSSGRTGWNEALGVRVRAFPSRWGLRRASGKDQVMMKVSGACYLEPVGRELSAIQAFEARVKKNPSLFRGFQGASVEQIREQVKAGDEAQYTYRTFQLHCRSDRKM